MARWAAAPSRIPGIAATRHATFEEDAIVACMTLGDRRADAERLLEFVKQSNPKLKTTTDLLREMMRLRGGSNLEFQSDLRA